MIGKGRHRLLTMEQRREGNEAELVFIFARVPGNKVGRIFSWTVIRLRKLRTK